VTVKTGNEMVTLKGAKDFDAPVGAPIGVAIAPDRTYAFVGPSGARLR
jgi:hypothetical protein